MDAFPRFETASNRARKFVLDVRATVNGKCPGCNQTGEVGEPCSETACAKQEYRFIPESYFDRVHDRDGAGPDPLIGRCVGDFLVVDFLGSGGFGKVYLGLQQPLFRLRGAIKILESPDSHQELADALLEKFRREAEVLAELSHPNIVRLLKYGTHRGRPYLVMEYLEKGHTLGREIELRAREERAFSQEELGHIMRQILNGLEAAHERNIIHRDLKPENLMLQEVVGNPYHVRILDFGIAKIVETRADTQWPLGSPSYMAPEQANLENLGTWTDMYALGVLFFELTTGCRPFPGGSKELIMSRKLSDDFDPFERVRDLEIPEPTLSFMRRAIATDPEDRLRTVEEFREALEPALQALVDQPDAMGPGGEALTFSMDTGEGKRPDAPAGEAPVPSPTPEDGEADDAAEPRVTADAALSNDAVEAPDPEIAAGDAEASGTPDAPAAASRSSRVQAEDAKATTDSRSLRVLLVAFVTIAGGLGSLYALYGADGLASILTPGFRIVSTSSDATSDTTSYDTGAADTSDGPSTDGRTMVIGPLESDGGDTDASDLQDDDALDVDDADSEVDAETDIDARPILPGDAIVQLSAGKYHTCALRADGRLRCWGDNRDGQLGLGHTEAIGDDESIETLPWMTFEPPVEQVVSAGDRHASFNCVLLEDGAVRCWGDNQDGQLGYGHTNTIGNDESIDDLPDVQLGGRATQLTAGASKYGSHVCALLRDDSLRCWGNAKFGKLGYGHTNVIGDDAPPVTVGNVPVGGKIASVDAGKYNTCVILKDRTLRCWGWNKHGQLGLGHTRDIGDDEIPTSVPPVDVGGPVAQVSVGRRHVCAILQQSRKVRCWGWNEHGQLGLGHTENIGDDETPSSVEPVDLEGPARSVVTGSLHSCALLESGDVQCWGDNRLGQLGYGHEQTVGDKASPRHAGTVYLGAPVRSLTAGRFHNCALLQDRSVRCWGYNGRGQLGYGHKNHIGDDEPPGSVSPVPLD